MLKLATVFSGIGAVEHALQRMGIKHEIVFACDNGDINIWRNKSDEEKDFIKKEIMSIKDHLKRKLYVDNLYSQTKKQNYVQQSYCANYKISNERFYQDVCFLDGTPYKGKVDLLVGGSPCQSFSLVGKRGGFEDTRGTLFYEFIRLVKEIQPKVFIYENVKGVVSHDQGKTWDTMQNVFNDIGYFWVHDILNAKDFGIPQNRERLFVIGFREKVNFKFPPKRPLTTKMKDYLLDNVPQKYYLGQKGVDFVTNSKNLTKRYTQINGEIALCQKANQQFNWHGDFVLEEKYFLSKKLVDYVLATGTKNFYSKPEIDLEIARPILSTLHKMHRAGVDNYVTTKGRIRKLTPRECLRLMGFCDSFKQVVSDTQMYRQAGNSIVVDVLMSIMEQIFKTTNILSTYDQSKSVAL